MHSNRKFLLNKWLLSLLTIAIRLVATKRYATGGLKRMMWPRGYVVFSQKTNKFWGRNASRNDPWVKELLSWCPYYAGLHSGIFNFSGVVFLYVRGPGRLEAEYHHLMIVHLGSSLFLFGISPGKGIKANPKQRINRIFLFDRSEDWIVFFAGNGDGKNPLLFFVWEALIWLISARKNE